MASAVVISDVHKTFTSGKTEVKALQAISLEVKPGELFGLIGPDGAGKTTLFRILTTLMIPTSGTATVDGFDVVKDFKSIRQRVGYMPGKFSLYQDLSVEENLAFFATLFNTSLEENYDLVKSIYQQIEPFRKRRAGALSGGMKQKLALSCALIHRPSVLFLDEPTTGVDAVSRKEFWELLHQLQQHGITIVVSTPYMDEAGLCERVALIQEGRILQIDTPKAITSGFRKPLWSVRAEGMYQLMLDIRKMPEVESCYPFGQEHHVVFRQTLNEDEAKRLIQPVAASNLDVKRIDATIEDCFMDLMHV